MKRIAFFDFDGTITHTDTLLAFIRFQKGSFLFYAGFLLNSPWLLAYKLKLISNQAAKERILTHFFGGMLQEDFQAHADRFANSQIPLLLRSKAVGEIRKLQEAGFDVVIVTASPENWVRGWSSQLPATLIATTLVIRQGRITGKIEGRNVHGEEKRRRIQELFDLSGYASVYAYGDTKGDKPMLELAALAFYKPFR